MSSESASEKRAMWTPLRHKMFLMIWIASLFSNIGTWMHEIGAGWLMTSLAPSPFMVALVQAATTFPVFLLALPAGALADIIDRRHYLIGTQIWMALMAGLLGIFTLLDMMNAGVLLLLTFGLGIGSGMMMPAWGAIIPELVPKEDLADAVSLNSVGINASRAIGPALAGLIIAATSPGVVFVLNALSFFTVIIALYLWRRDERSSSLPAEQLIGAVRAGARYARHSPELRAILVRLGAFTVFASSLWALIPLFVRQNLHGGPNTYGIFLAAMGIGAVAGAFILPYLRVRVSRDKIIAGAILIYLAGMLVLAYSGSIYIGIASMFFCGMGWISAVSSTMAAAQAVLPAWVRARGLAFFWVVYMGTMALGSAIWGQVAAFVGIPMSMTLAAGGAVFALLITWNFQIGPHEVLDLTPSIHWPTPHIRDESEMDRGPVMVTIEYVIDPARLEEFTVALNDVGRLRRRDGVFLWEMFHDMDKPNVIVECFMIESWLEHLRQHERETAADKHIYKSVRAFHIADHPPKIKHYIGGHLQEGRAFIW